MSRSADDLRREIQTVAALYDGKTPNHLLQFQLEQSKVCALYEVAAQLAEIREWLGVERESFGTHHTTETAKESKRRKT